MSLRFAIIKHVKTLVGNEYEDIVFEYDEGKIFNNLRDLVVESLPDKKTWLGRKKRYTEEEIIGAVEKAWDKNIKEFKKLTVRIF